MTNRCDHAGLRVAMTNECCDDMSLTPQEICIFADNSRCPNVFVMDEDDYTMQPDQDSLVDDLLREADVLMYEKKLDNPQPMRLAKEA